MKVSPEIIANRPSRVAKSGQVWASLLCAIETKETTIHVNYLTINLSTNEY